jgi:hypothetical protein
MPFPSCRPTPARSPAPRPALGWSASALAALLILGPGAVTAAQEPAHHPSHHPSHHPAQRQADAPQSVYRSAFGLYRPWQDQAVGDWRALNDRVGRIGGWRTYLREAHAPEPPEPPGPSTAPATGPAAKAGATPAAPPRPHAGHGHGAHHGTAGPATQGREDRSPAPQAGSGR